MAVGQDEAPDLFSVFQQVGGVGDHEVDSQHLLFRKHEAGIDDQEVLFRSDHGHIHPDLPYASEGDDGNRIGPRRNRIYQTRASTRREGLSTCFPSPCFPAERKAGEQSGFQHLLHFLHQDEFHAPSHLSRHLLDVFVILGRHDDPSNPSSTRCQDLLFDPAHGQTFPLQGDLPGHGYVLPHPVAGEGGDQRRRHGDPGRRSVFGNGPGGNMHMDVRLGKSICPRFPTPRPWPGRS